MLKTILLTTLIAGTLDIVAACLQAYLKSGTMPGVVLSYIASGVFGKAAFSGSMPMQLVGLLFHFVIVFACTACFFWLYPKWAFLQNTLWLNSAMIALVAWVVTTQVIIPFTPIKQPAFNVVSALQAIAILFFCIGLPIAYSAWRYFEAQN